MPPTSARGDSHSTVAAGVLALARGDGPEVRRSLCPGFDIGCVEDLTARHQVAALCHWLWKDRLAQEPDAVPDRVAASLRTTMQAHYLFHRSRNKVLLDSIERIDQALAAEGVRPLYFKGSWLAFHAYPDPGTRPVGDIDLGIVEREYGRVIPTLTALGYRTSHPLPDTTERAIRHAHYRGQLRFRHPSMTPVELHFRMVNFGPPGLDEDWIRESAQLARLGSREVRVPAPEAMVTHALLHANQHAFSILRMLHDIRWLLGAVGDSLDWPLVVARVASLRCRAAAYNALVLARDLAGAAVPQPVLDELHPWWLRQLLFEQVWSLRSVRRLEASPRPTELEAPLFYLLEVGSAAEKLQFLREVVLETGGLGRFLKRARAAMRLDRHSGG